MLLMHFFLHVLCSPLHWAQWSELKIAAHVQNSPLLTPYYCKFKNEIVSISISHIPVLCFVTTIRWEGFWKCWAMGGWSRAMLNLPLTSKFFQSLKASLCESFQFLISPRTRSQMYGVIFLFSPSGNATWGIQ